MNPSIRFFVQFGLAPLESLGVIIRTLLFALKFDGSFAIPDICVGDNPIQVLDFLGEILPVQIRHLVVSQAQLELFASRLEFVDLSATSFVIALERRDGFFLMINQRFALLVLVSKCEVLVRGFRSLVSRCFG